MAVIVALVLGLTAILLLPCSPRLRAQGTTAESDRDFLRQQGLAPETEPTPAPKPTPSAASQPPKPKPAPTPRARSRPPAPVPPPTAPAPRPESPQQNVFTNVPAAPPDNGITREEAARFLRRFLAAGAANNPAEELACYAPTVSYYNQGRRNRDFIARDQTRYRRRWPLRRYELDGEPELTPDGVIHYRLRFEVQNPPRVSSGQAAGEIAVRRTGTLGPDGSPGFEVVTIREQVERTGGNGGGDSDNAKKKKGFRLWPFGQR